MIEAVAGWRTLPLLGGESQEMSAIVSALLWARASCPHPRRHAGATPALPGREKGRAGRIDNQGREKAHRSRDLPGSDKYLQNQLDLPEKLNYPLGNHERLSP